MTIHPDILQWAKTRPLWQQDAIRRLAESASLTQQDLSQIVELCRIEYGVAPSLGQTGQALPLAQGQDVHSADDVILRRIFGLRNVNALHADQECVISPTGLTVVYGDNGAGKSGYVRFLKQLCRARGMRDVIHQNVYGESGAAEGRLAYDVNGVSFELSWTDGTIPPEAVREISIFDSKAASVYVGAENDVAYLPHGMDLFPRLVAITDLVRQALESERSSLEASRDAWSDFQPTTKTFQLLQKLDTKNAKDRGRELSTFSPEELARLDELRILDRKYKSDDPKGRARSHRLCIERLTTAKGRLLAVEAALNDSRLDEFRTAHDAVAAARGAVELATSLAFTDAPIKGVGTDTWNILWSAARTFAEDGAVPGRRFPPIVGDLCVLCQQPVAESAADRLKRFQEFVAGTAQSAFVHATTDLETRRRALASLNPALIASTELLAEIASLDVELEALLRECIASLTRRHASSMASKRSDDLAQIEGLSNSHATRLADLVARIEKDAVTYEAADKPDERRLVEDELRELEARGQLALALERVDQQIERLRKIEMLKKAATACNTRAITIKNTELLEKTVTLPLAEAFEKERFALRLGHVPIGLKARGSKATTLHSLSLDATNAGGTAAKDVLSEGEHRAVALAAFFAEVGLQESKATLVFDDPVSSLDHGRRMYVAQRIAQLAKDRPVLIFTHDLVFLWMLQGSAEECDVNLEPRLFRRDANGSGLVTNEWPWDGQKVKTRLGVLRNSHVGLKKLSGTDRSAYEAQVAPFYGKLRSTWERAVEEVLFKGAIRRFDTDVKTLALGKLHKVTEAQLKALEAGMTKTSMWIEGHDHAAALGMPIPEPSELESDLVGLESWVKDINDMHSK